MKRLKIVYILMAILLLAGCAATPGATEIPSREEQETGHIALTGQPAESEPSPEHFEDTVSVEETPYQWDFQKGWKVFDGYFNLPEHIVSTGTFCLLGLPYTEWISKANDDAEQQGEEVLFHVFFRAETDVTAFGVPAEPVTVTYTVAYDGVEQGEYTGYHADLSLADMLQLSTLADVHFDFCTCGREHDEYHTVKLWWDAPDVDWDFKKDLPLFVFRPEDEELYWDFPDMCFPYGNARWYCLTTAFDVLGEEMLYHVTIREHVVESGDGTLTVDPENTPVGDFLEYFGIPYEIAESVYHLNLSYRDAVTLVGLMHKAGLVESEKAGVFDFCYCGDLCGATHTVSPALPEWYEVLRK